MRKVLINAANLHNGGGVQVAVSFLYELLKDPHKQITYDLTVFSSTEVDENLRSLGININKNINYKIFNIYSLQVLKPQLAKFFYGFDLIFTIFGPLYLPKKIQNHIIGFAQLWILHPNNEISKRFSIVKKIIYKVKFSIQWFFFKNLSARLVVELPHVKRRLISFKGYPEENIDVVSNCFSSIYLDKDKWLPLHHVPKTSKPTIKIGYLSRAYVHKNLDILPKVANELSKFKDLKFEFFVTLNSNELNSFSQDFKLSVTNLGSLNVSQCPAFYQAMDGIIFTSLLECFSATPIEALIMRRPLFASDRDFVRDVCGEHANYVNPLNPMDIAQKIYNWYAKKSEIEKSLLLDQAYNHALRLPNSTDRALRYIEIINNQLLLTKKV